MSGPRTAVLVAFLALMAGCGMSSEGDGTTLTVLAAASLADAMPDLAEAFEADRQVQVETTFGPSSGLREQVLAGVPADVYASANAANMELLVDADAVEEPRVLARNQLEIAVPEGNPAGVTGLDDFARDEMLIGLCAEEVPCGSAASEVFDSAGIDPAPDTEASDVRALLTLLEEGEIDAGLIYVTDVLATEGAVEGIDIPVEHSVSTKYLIAPLARSGDPASAAAFVDFVVSERGQSILRAHGFDT